MANFMEQMYQEHSPENKAKKERQFWENYYKSLAGDVCSEVENSIRSHWDTHQLEGYIGLYVLDGNNISFSKKLIKGDKKAYGERKTYTYSGYLKIKSEEDANIFMDRVKKSLAEDGVKNFRIRKEKITVESYDPNTILKIKQKEYDAYVFYIDVKW